MDIKEFLQQGALNIYKLADGKVYVMYKQDDGPQIFKSSKEGINEALSLLNDCFQNTAIAWNNDIAQLILGHSIQIAFKSDLYQVFIVSDAFVSNAPLREYIGKGETLEAAFDAAVAALCTKPPTVYNKLVRDGIPEHIQSVGDPFKIRIAESDEEFEVMLLKKLKEEAQEFAENPGLDEFVDMLEVMEAAKKYYGWDTELVETKRLEKFLKKGGFENRIILIES